MENKIVITGAGGFIGSHLVDFLLTKYSRSSLRLLVSEKDSLKNLPNTKLDIFRGDIRNKLFVKSAMEGASTIYHLASLVGFEGSAYKDYKEVNVDGTQNILDACKKKTIQKFVFVSSIAVYGLPAWTGDILNLNEKNSYNPSEIYGKSKMEAEMKVISMHKSYGIPYTIIRPVSVYGPRDKGQIFSLYKSLKNHTFIFIGNGKNKMHYIYVQNLVEGMYKAQINKSEASDFILGDSTPIRFNDVVKFAARSINEPFPKLRISKNLGLILGYAGSGIEKLTGLRSPIFPSRIKVMTTNWYYDISKARTLLNFKPKISFEDGAVLTGKWFLSQNL